MKILAVLLICVAILTGCSYNMRYNIPSDKTLSDFERQKAECGIDKINRGGFVFGPAVFVGAVAGVDAIIKKHQNNKFQDCMERAGYKCVDDCPRGE